MAWLQKSKTKVSSRRQIHIKGVRDGILILPGDHYRAVLEVSSINFELKSEVEQDALIETYESFLNALGHPLQILIRTREIDLDRYLTELTDRLAGETETVYRDQLQNYAAFIRRLVTHNKILTRRFYVVVPYSAGPKLDFELIKGQLSLMLDMTAKGLGRLGMHARVLTSLELLDLFYSFYNPELAKLQPLSEQALQLVHSSYIKQAESAHD